MVNLDNLFNRIDELGLNAKKVSENTGISTGNISDWKSGRSMPSAVKLDILATYLNCSVDYLLGRTNRKEMNILSIEEHQIYTDAPFKAARTGTDSEVESLSDSDMMDIEETLNKKNFE